MTEEDEKPKTTQPGAATDDASDAAAAPDQAPAASGKEPVASGKESAAPGEESAASDQPAANKDPADEISAASHEQPTEPGGSAAASAQASAAPDTESAESESAADATASPATPVAPASRDAAATEQPTEPRKRRGGLVGVFALLLAFAAAGGVGYLYYVLVYLEPLAELEVASANNRADADALRNEITAQLEASQRENRELVDGLSANLAERFASNEEAVLESLNEAINQAPPSQREWKLAEAEYLMRIANHRVLMEDDSAGALRLLQTADRIIAELDDFSLQQVRAQLADEILALQQVRRDDLQGIYLKLEALKLEIGKLNVETPEYFAASDGAVEDRSVWDTITAEMKDLVRIRSVAADDPVKPLLAPEEERYLELNLRLSIEQAQLAVLKRHQTVYDHSLSRVSDWLDAYLDTDDARTVAARAALDELIAIELARALPDISGSLNSLDELRRGAGR